MDRATAEDVVEEFESAYPEAFRAAVYYEVEEDDDVTYEALQVRDDVDDAGDDGEPAEIVSAIVEDALAEDTGTEWHDGVWDAGPIHYSMWMFGDVTVVHFGREPETRGFLASVDTEMSPFFQRLVEKTLGELENSEDDWDDEDDTGDENSAGDEGDANGDVGARDEADESGAGEAGGGDGETGVSRDVDG